VSKSPIHNTPAKILGLSPEELEKIKEQFPYFNSARMQLLRKRLSEGAATDSELTSSAVYSGDRKMLYDFLKRKSKPESVPVVQEDIKPAEEDMYIIPKVETITPKEPVIMTPQPAIGEQHTEVEETQANVIPVIEEAKEAEIHTQVEETTITESKQTTLIQKKEEETEEDEEVSTVTLPEARKFMIADHTFDEWIEHFKRGKQNVKKAIEDMPKAKDEAADELDRLIESSLPATFFHDKLESETQYAKGLENFIDSQKKKKASLHKHVETGLVTETLAKIYERQGLVDKAIGVFEQLILKNPEKSAYFAVQIERLKNK
jgi:tetratricopeptide (TPR) repeat protein